MIDDIEKLGYEWITADAGSVDVGKEYYCNTADVFQSRLYKMKIILSRNEKLKPNAAILTAVAGEIGNNSFDHNLGNWPDVMGIFFGYEIINDKCVIVMADRGLGILKTLQRVKPELNDDKEALEIAFTQIISSRSPEQRGNGLKFVKNSIKDTGFHLKFFSGKAEIEINNKLELKEKKENINGCLAVINSN